MIGQLEPGDKMGGPDIKSNQTLQILQAAYQGQYGVLATIA